MHRTIHIESLERFLLRDAEPGFVFPGNIHEGPELLYVDRGTLHCVVEGLELILSPGDLVLFNAGQFHMVYGEGADGPRYLSIVFKVRDADLSVLANRKLPAPTMAPELLQLVAQEWQHPDPYSPGLALSALEILLMVLLRESGNPSPNARTAHAIHTENQVIRRAQQYISAHVREKLPVPLVARKADVSPSYLTALFHQHLGISPGDYIRRIKLQKSKELIREGSMNFTEIAAALSYSTVHHFSRQFKEKFGITPTEYARSVR
jgi:AraC-like DNA-binding protein